MSFPPPPTRTLRAPQFFSMSAYRSRHDAWPSSHHEFTLRRNCPYSILAYSHLARQDTMPYMTTQAIHFGTSGWRGSSPRIYLPGVRRASAAIAAHVLAQKKNPTLIVGYDTDFSPRSLRARRLGSPADAAACFSAMARRHPAIAHAIIHGNLDGGVNNHREP